MLNKYFSDLILFVKMSAHKSKRYFGRDYNVRLNIFFEELMKSVSKSELRGNIICYIYPSNLDPSKNLAYLPSGFVSRSTVSRKFGLTVKVRWKHI